MGVYYSFVYHVRDEIVFWGNLQQHSYKILSENLQYSEIGLWLVNVYIILFVRISYVLFKVPSLYL